MKFALCIEYDGSLFHGWQAQRNQSTVQEAVEKALSTVADHAVSTCCAGRTDAGVHACGQIVHFETLSQRDEYAWLLGTNTYLPDGISVLWIHAVEDAFHARFSAIRRSYRYIMLNRRVRPANLHRNISWHPLPLNAEAMRKAAQVLVGTHDFSAFRSSQCQNKRPTRTVVKLHVSRKGDWVWIDIEADGFLHHMVRNIVGSLREVGSSKDSAWLERVLHSKDRSQAGVTASPNGLYFLSAAYPKQYLLPPMPPPIRFW